MMTKLNDPNIMAFLLAHNHYSYYDIVCDLVQVIHDPHGMYVYQIGTDGSVLIHVVYKYHVSSTMSKGLTKTFFFIGARKRALNWCIKHWKKNHQ